MMRWSSFLTYGALASAMACVVALGGCAAGSMNTDDDGTADVCGDGDCTGSETAQSCADDCAAAPSCGDHACNGNENATTCPADCGGTTATCGDHTCNGNETINTCPGDCGGTTATCGDGNCNGGETAATCPGDCTGGGTCGNAVCDAGETATSCPSDCTGTATGCGDFVCDVAAGECTSIDLGCILDCVIDAQCGGSATGSCDHDVCTQGGPLLDTCDACSAAVCAQDSVCCTDSWDDICVSEVATYCTGVTC